MHGLQRCAAAIVVAVLSIGTGACQKKKPILPTPTPTVATHGDWQKFVDSYLEDYFRAHPQYAAAQGRHEYDGQFPDWSAAGIQKEIARLHTEVDAAKAFTDAELTERQRFERDYLIATTEHDLFWLENSGAPFRNPQFYLSIIDTVDPSLYVTHSYGTPEQRLRGFIKYAENIPAAARQIRENLRLPLPATFIHLGVAGFGGLASTYIKDVPQAFAGVKDADLQEQLKKVIGPAAKAMRELADALQSGEKNATADYALGAKSFAEMLWMTERVNTPLEQIEAIGRADLKRNQDALAEACGQFLPKASIKKCVDKVSADKPKGGAIEGARAQLAELKKFVVDHGVVTVPSDEEAQVAQAPPYNAQNFAYIEVPGPYDKGTPSIYFIAPPDPKWSKAEQAAYLPGKASLLFTSVHEVWPGHFLQFLHSNRSAFPYGRLFVGYAFAEGWAHYGEEMMWEEGLGAGDPEIHIGQIIEALLRDVRFISAIGLHTKGMTVAESEKMFREQAYQDPGNARQQAARGTYDPPYLNYTLGKLMIRKLRDDWTATRGGRAAWREFHDKFLSYGGPPIPLVRNQMMAGAGGGLF